MIILANPFYSLLAMLVTLVSVILLLCWIIYRHNRVLREVVNLLRVMTVNHRKPDDE